ncbi:hypothetical protein [Dactylosporangium cerinum]
MPASALDLMHAYGASPTTTLWRVQVPSALPALFAAMRVAAPSHWSAPCSRNG